MAPKKQPAAPKEKLPVATVELGGEQVRLTFGSRAQFRLSSLPHGAPDLRDMRNPRKAFHAICCYLWALLPVPVADEYATPEDIAEAVNSDNAEVVANAIKDAIIEAANKTKGEAGKG